MEIIEHTDSVILNTWPFPFDITLEIFRYCPLESILLGIQLGNKYLHNIISNHSEIIWQERLDRLVDDKKIKFKNLGFEKVEKGTELKSQIMLRILKQQTIYAKKKLIKNYVDKLEDCKKYAKQSNILAGFIVSKFASQSNVGLESFNIDLFEFMYDIDPFFYMKQRLTYPIGFLFICCFKSNQVKNVKSKSFTQTKWKLAQDKILPTTIVTIKQFLREFYKISASAALSTALIHYYQMPYKQLDGQYLTAHEYYQQVNSESKLPTDKNLETFLNSQMYHFLPDYSSQFKLITTSKKTISFSLNK